MIDVHFTQDEAGYFTKLEIRGHAFFAEAGSDIVCAAVSTLALTLVNNIERMTKIKPNVTLDEQIGHLVIKLKPSNNQTDEQLSQTLMRHTYLALKEDVAKTYPENVRVMLHSYSID